MPRKPLNINSARKKFRVLLIDAADGTPFAVVHWASSRATLERDLREMYPSAKIVSVKVIDTA